MHRSYKNERGQALILIVFAIVGMIGLTGLAIDGGNAYSDRRHAQNAADTSVLAAALAKIRQPAGVSPADAWKSAGYGIATANGYTTGTVDKVVVYSCSEAHQADEPDCVLATGADPTQFVQVIITSTIRTYFAPVVGLRQITNQVQAIARAVPSIAVHYFDGAAITSTMEGCKPSGWPAPPFVVGGSSVTLVGGAQVFVNSNCDPDFITGGNGSFTSAGGICLNGQPSAGNTGVSPAPVANCGTPIDVQQYNYPDVAAQCALLGAGSITDTGGGNYFATPGNYNGGAFPNVSPAGNLKLQKGLYCLNNGLSLQGTWDMTTDLNGNGSYDSANEGVLFYVPHGGVTFNGGSTVHLHAVTVAGCTQAGLNGLLIYLPLTNDSTVKIAGGNNSTYTGTILAPASLVTLEGGSSSASDTIDLETQVIGYSISIGGGGNLNIHYDACVTSMSFSNPLLQPYK